MARLKLLGAETGDLSELLVVGANTSADGTVFNNSAGGKGGTYSYKTTGASGSSHFWRDGNASHPRFKCAFRFDTDTTPGTEVDYQILGAVGTDGTTINMVLYLVHKTDGTFAIAVQDNAGAVNYAPVTVVKNTWYLLDIDLTIGNGTGALIVKLNGVTQVNLTGQNYAAVNVKYWQALAHGNATGRNFWIDDIVVDDAASIGESYVKGLPIKSGTPAYDSWTKSLGGDVSAEWNDVPFSATTYARALLASAAQTALVDVSGIGSGDTINGVKFALVGKTDFTDAAGLAQVGTAQQGSSTAGADVTLTFSTAPKAGDVVIVTGGHILRTGTNYGPSTAGYTQIGTLQTSGSSGTGLAFGAWYKVMGTSPDTTVVCQGSGTAGDGVGYTSKVLRQADPSTQLDVSAVFSTPTTATNPDPAAITPSSANCAIVIAAASLVSDTNIGGATNYTGQASANAAATRPYSTSILHRILSGGAGSSENPPAIGSTGNSWSSGLNVAVTIAIRPTTQAGSALSHRRRIGGTDTDTAITLTTADAYYEGSVLTSLTYTDLSTAEIGALHGSTSALQTVEDVFCIVEYLPAATTNSAGSASGVGAASATGAATAGAAGSAAGIGAAAGTGAQIDAAAGSAAGVGAAAGAGGQIAAAAGSAAGTGSAAATGAAVTPAAGSAAGVGAAAATSGEIAAAAGSAAGIGAGAGAGAEIAAAAGSAAGIGAAAGAGVEIAAAAGSAAGTGTATGTGAAVTPAAGSAAGVGTASATGEAVDSGSTVSGDGSAAGTGTATGAGAQIAAAAGSSAGNGSAAAAGAEIAAAAGSAAGVGAATASGAEVAAAAGSSAGAGAATGAGGEIAAGAGVAVGAGSAAAVGAEVVGGAGSAAGTGDAAAASNVIYVAFGQAAGVGSASATGAATAGAAASSSGTGTATGASGVIAAAAGTAAGIGSATAVSPGVAPRFAITLFA